MRRNFNKENCIKGKEGMLKVLEEERSPQKIHHTYIDAKLNAMVTVLESQEVPYRKVPVGWVSE